MQESQLKHIVKAALMEVLTERRDLFVEIVKEALEDHALGLAIQEGLENDLVTREEVFKVLSQKS